jgi:hypothetical protein
MNQDQIQEKALAATYAAISLFTQRVNTGVVKSLLKAVGDVSLIEAQAGLFGKQRYSEFTETTKSAAFNPALRFTAGYDPSRIPAEDAFTVLDLLRILSDDAGNHVLFEDPNFKYSRIGRGRIDASELLTPEEQKEIQDLTLLMLGERDAKKVTEYTNRIATISSSKKALVFVADPAPNGYSIMNLTWNEERPNVSILVRKTGHVDLSSRIPDNQKGKIPEIFPTNIWRNYAMVKDGLVNVEKLPCKVTASTVERLKAAGLSVTPDANMTVLFDLRSLPVINQKMIGAISAESFFKAKCALLQAQAIQKVYNSYSKELIPGVKTAGFAELYGAEGAAWLKDQGLTGGGFSPKVVQAATSDFYVGKELEVSIKGFGGALPSLKDLKTQAAKGKFNAGGSLMKGTYEEVEAFLASSIYKNAAKKEAVLEAWLDGQTKAAVAKTRSLIYDIAQTTFCLVVGQIWFSEFSSLDENSMTIEVDGQSAVCTAKMNDVEIKI